MHPTRGCLRANQTEQSAEKVLIIYMVLWEIFLQQSTTFQTAGTGYCVKHKGREQFD